jgi:hypothetical protein
MTKKVFFLSHAEARQRAAQYCKEAPQGLMVTFTEPIRTSEQSAKFHAICGDLAKSKLLWAGKPRTSSQWKVLLVSGHASATKEEFEIIPGLDGELVNIRESTALMSKQRGSSLIEFSIAFCALNGVKTEL